MNEKGFQEKMCLGFLKQALQQQGNVVNVRNAVTGLTSLHAEHLHIPIDTVLQFSVKVHSMNG